MTAKEELLDISLKLFAKVGYENTGIAQIVKSAGVTKPTLYHHYGNKDGLLKSIIEQYGKELIKTLEGAIIYEGDVIGTMDRLVIAYVGFGKRYPTFFRLYKQLYQSPEGSDSYRIIKPFYDQILEAVKTLFEKVGTYHTNLKDKEEWMAFSLLGLMDAYIHHHLSNKDLETLDEVMCRKVAKQFLYGVFA